MSLPITFKHQVYQHFQQTLAGKLGMLQAALKELLDSAANETKSTAGDKYETARAMLHIEQDNIRKQQTEALAQKAVLDRIDVNASSPHIALGSLVCIDRDYYFVSAALGKVLLDGHKVIALSPQSPLGMLLMKKVVGDKVAIGGIDRSIAGIA